MNVECACCKSEPAAGPGCYCGHAPCVHDMRALVNDRDEWKQRAEAANARCDEWLRLFGLAVTERNELDRAHADMARRMRFHRKAAHAWKLMARELFERLGIIGARS